MTILFILVIFIVWPLVGTLWLILNAIDPTTRGWFRGPIASAIIPFMALRYTKLLKHIK